MSSHTLFYNEEAGGDWNQAFPLKELEVRGKEEDDARHAAAAAEEGAAQ